MVRAYPRMHGGTGCGQSGGNFFEGLSPHARGNRVRSSRLEARLGPIPACTGEPSYVRRLIGAPGAYPRMHGGTGALAAGVTAEQGLSPHARGNHGLARAKAGAIGPIPACTGEPLCFARQRPARWAYPRMHGGTASRISLRIHHQGLSPHARGNLEVMVNRHVQPGPIPACTGEPLLLSL